jgi:hypothetical protein
MRGAQHGEATEGFFEERRFVAEVDTMTATAVRPWFAISHVSHSRRDILGPSDHTVLSHSHGTSAHQVLPMRREHDCREDIANEHIHDGPGAEREERSYSGTRQLAKSPREEIAHQSSFNQTSRQRNGCPPMRSHGTLEPMSLMARGPLDV